MFRRYCLPWLVFLLYRVWSATWRVTIVPCETTRALLAAGAPLVFAHWHRDELALLPHVGRFRIATMTSLSRDGQLIDWVLRRFGAVTVKGSSSRGGASALRSLVRLVRGGRSASVAVDGPRGPIFKAKPGVFELSRLTGAAIVPVGIASCRRYIFERSWNQARLPKPFTRVVIYFGEPLPADREHQPDPKCPLLAARLDEQIYAACQRARACGAALVKHRPVAQLGGFTARTA